MVNEKPGCVGNILNEVVVVFYCLHAVNEYAGVGDEYYLTIGEIMVGDYRQWTGGLILIPGFIPIQVEEAEWGGQGESIIGFNISEACGMIKNQALDVVGYRIRCQVWNPREPFILIVAHWVKENLP